MSSEESIIKTQEALRTRGMDAVIVNTQAEALSKIKELIPSGASVNNGSSRTLEQIGYIDYLKTKTHGWNNLHAGIIEEQDEVKKVKLRNEALFSDYYLGSAHAIAETGEIVVASASGSQLPHLVFTSPNLILVVGAQKIVSNYEDAMKRVREFVVPLEDARMKEVGMGGTILSKILTIEHEPKFMGRTVTVILVKEPLGF